MIRIIADTSNARQHWERRSDPLPYLMVPMSDGSTVRYVPDIPQPDHIGADLIRDVGFISARRELNAGRAVQNGLLRCVHKFASLLVNALDSMSECHNSVYHIFSENASDSTIFGNLYEYHREI
ncbi:MAG: hypothetical protein II723_08220 [Oscillospiraceae bacterium]|nr:hypothetical protein [Oscillospiraceae bacterium]